MVRIAVIKLLLCFVVAATEKVHLDEEALIAMHEEFLSEAEFDSFKRRLHSTERPPGNSAPKSIFRNFWTSLIGGSESAAESLGKSNPKKNAEALPLPLLHEEPNSNMQEMMEGGMMGGSSPGDSSMNMMGLRPEEHDTIHQLFGGRTTMTRSIVDILGDDGNIIGTNTTTTSSDPAIVQALRVHVYQMYQAKEDITRMIREEDPL